MEANVLNATIKPLWRVDLRRADRHRGDRANKETVAERAGAGRVAMHNAVLQRLAPALRAFCPDLILISAGFDAGRGDVGNLGPRGAPGTDFSPDDFNWATQQVLAIARVCCPGRVVSVLEGGYGRAQFVRVDATPPPAAAPPPAGATAGAGAAPAPAPAPTASAPSASAAPAVRFTGYARDILVANVVAHMRALVDDGGAPPPPSGTPTL